MLAQTSMLAAVGTVRSRMTDESVQIRPFVEGDLEAIVEFSLRAWAPVFASVRTTLGDEVFLRLHPIGRWIRRRRFDQAA